MSKKGGSELKHVVGGNAAVALPETPEDRGEGTLDIPEWVPFPIGEYIRITEASGNPLVVGGPIRQFRDPRPFLRCNGPDLSGCSPSPYPQYRG